MEQPVNGKDTKRRTKLPRTMEQQVNGKDTKRRTQLRTMEQPDNGKDKKVKLSNFTTATLPHIYKTVQNYFSLSLFLKRAGGGVANKRGTCTRFPSEYAPQETHLLRVLFVLPRKVSKESLHPLPPPPSEEIYL